MRVAKFRAGAADEAKAARTKALLMDAGVAVIARRGIESTPISAITQLAKVANGTFYYHYRDKAEFVDALGHSVAASLVNEVDEAMTDIEDGRERVAVATQLFVRLAAAKPTLGWMIVHALNDMGKFRASITRGIRKDVILGFEQRHFTIEPTDISLALLLALVSAGLKARLENPGTAGIESVVAETVLRTLGIESKRAHKLAAQASVRVSVLSKRRSVMRLVSSPQ